MYISKVKIENFRLLKDSTLDIEKQEKKDLSLLIGRNNSGKTSFIMLFDKFLKSSTSPNFNFDDFPILIRKEILNIKEDTDEFALSIKLIIEITYSESDSLGNISDLILDLDPEENKVKILFECLIDKNKIIKELAKLKKNRDRFIKKNLKKYLTYKIYVFDDDKNIEKEFRSNLIEKERKDIDKILNFQVIHANRSVSSSESNESAKTILSNIATSYFNKKTENQLTYDDLDEINSSLLDMDIILEEKYQIFFKDYLNKSKDFLGMSDLRVISDLVSKEIISHHSKIVYGSESDSLPEHLNGLGFINILYLLLQLEIKKEYFIEGEKDINILFIEEPEAHTHPQMQTIFIEKIKDLLSEIPSIQTFITTHSSHIVKNCDFKDIRYMYNDIPNNNVIIKNFYIELKEKYKDEESNFKFLNQYLTIASSELFFAEKIIFIEGLTERLLLPYFMEKYDKASTNDIKLSSQNISILEVGANAKAFRHFIKFLDIKTLIITDIDTTIKNASRHYEGHIVKGSTHTSNTTLRYFLDSPKFSQEAEFKQWFEKLKENKLHVDPSKIKLAYQIKEDDYHGRSFEEAFISLNIQNLKDNILDLEGIKAGAESELTNNKDFDDLTKKMLDKKSKFASSLLWLGLTKEVNWNMPLYIKEGLEWIAKK